MGDRTGTSGEGPRARLVRDAVDGFLHSREAADTVVGAVERAGHPWAFVPTRALAGRDLLRPGITTWPLVLPDGEMVGVVVRERDGSDRHDELITVLLRIFASVVAAEDAARDAGRRALAAEQEARVDSLTGLPNRRGWDDAIAAESGRIRRHGNRCVVIVIDLDGLKTTNDAEGHLAGDLLIRRASLAIRHAVRDEDVVARIGGDEFGVLAVESETGAPETLLGRVRDALASAGVEASAGAAASYGVSLEQAFAAADHDMYVAKRQRKAG